MGGRHGNNRIEEFNPTGAFLTSIPSAGVGAVAVDSAGDVFATTYNSADSCGSLPSPCYHLVEYSPAGAVLSDVGAGSIGGVTPSFLPDTVAVDDASGEVYVADPIDSLVWVFGPPSAPSIDTELAVQVTGSAATLGARLSPGALDTSYHFDYGTTTAYGQAAPVPDGDAGSGIRPGTVWATASGLQPNTTYHYRVDRNQLAWDGHRGGSDVHDHGRRLPERPVPHGPRDKLAGLPRLRDGHATEQRLRCTGEDRIVAGRPVRVHPPWISGGR